MEKDEHFPTKSENKAWVSDLTTPIQHCARSSSQCHKIEKEIKDIQIGKKDIKLAIGR